MFRRLISTFKARAVASYAPGPVLLGDRLWALDRRVRFPGGARLPIRSSVVALGDGSLVLISAPPALDDATVHALNAIGPVRAIVAPNTFHYLFVPESRARFPDAALYAAPGLAERIDFKSGASALDGDTNPWAGELEVAVLRGSPRSAEVIFLHRASRSLIITDALFNLAPMPRWRDRMTWRVGGIPRGLGPARTSRKLLLCDPASVAECIRTIGSWPVERLVVAHGENVEDDAGAKVVGALEPFAAARRGRFSER
jgi:hypothetical protein